MSPGYPRALIVSLSLMMTDASFAPAPMLGASQAEGAKTSIQERLKRVSADLFTRTDRVDDAIRELKAILAIDPNSAEGHLLLGIAYRSRRDPELMGEAVAELRQALALNPAMPPARLYLAYVYIDLGRADRAREELTTALAQVPGNPQFLALLGETERQLKNPQRAVELARQALLADESFAQGRYYLALALFDLGQREEAIKELERVVRSGPKVAEAYLSLGVGYLEAGRLDEALEILSQATHVDPSRSDIRIQLAHAYRMKGLLTRADEQLTIAMPKGAALASSLYQHQQVEFDLYLELGRLRLRQGRLEEAAAAFQKVLDMDPSHQATKEHLAEAQQRLQKRKTGAKK
jgi:tetratricopeptide (TPR) repeat protein